MDWQQIAVWVIVGAAMLAVGRRLWGQVAGFRSRPGGGSGGACDGCPSAGGSQNAGRSAKTNPAPLMQIQTRPPLHLRRPPSE